MLDVDACSEYRMMLVAEDDSVECNACDSFASPGALWKRDCGLDNDDFKVCAAGQRPDFVKYQNFTHS